MFYSKWIAFFVTFILNFSLSLAENLQCSNLFQVKNSHNSLSNFKNTYKKVLSAESDYLNQFYDPILITVDKELESLALDLNSWFADNQSNSIKNINFNNEYKIIVASLKKKSHLELYDATYGNYLLLNLYDPNTWREFLRQTLNSNRTVELPIYYRKYLFENMPKSLFDQLEVQLQNTTKFAQSFDKRKTAFRFLIYLDSIKNKPESKLLSDLKLTGNIQQALSNYFQSRTHLNQFNPYKSNSFLTINYFGRLVSTIKDFFTNTKLTNKYNSIFIFGSTPNGRSTLESDIDLALDIQLSSLDELALIKVLKSKLPDFTQNKEKLFESKIYSKKLLQFLYLSPVSIAIQKGKPYLVVRDELSINYKNFESLFYKSGFQNEGFFIKPFEFDLWYFPIDLDQNGNWSSSSTQKYFKLKNK